MPKQYRINGAVFQNDRPNGPIFSGTIEIDGQKSYISLWEKTSKGGKAYLQISEDTYAAQKAAGAAPQGQGAASKFRRPAPKPAPNNDDMDDDIPF